MEEPVPLDFPIPNEIIDMVMSYRSIEDLLGLAAIATDRLKKCSS